MKADDFLTVDNLRLQKIVDDFKTIVPQKFIVENGTEIMLEMLKAYDKSQNDGLMQTVNKMLEWIKTVSEFLSTEILRLNELQIAKRTRELNFTEKQELFTIATNSDDITCRIGAFLLLNEQVEAEKLLNEMPEEARNKFMTYPIFRFYIKKKDEKENG